MNNNNNNNKPSIIEIKLITNIRKEITRNETKRKE